ncbi:hypothetical protein COD02_22850 [Bacillus thuringiensis]|nr:hypothetical protein COD02_22850 [Bacillus thuringiensis]
MNVCPSLSVKMFDFIGEEGRYPFPFFYEILGMNRKRTLWGSFSRHINSKESIEMLFSNLYQEKNLKKLIMLLFLHISNIK